MQHILGFLEQQKNWKQFIKKSCRKNKIQVEIAGFFTPIKIRGFYNRLLVMYIQKPIQSYEEKPNTQSTCWVENELKAFHWILAVVSAIKERLIQDFTQEQWKIMSEIFINKDWSTIKYQSIKLVNERITKNRQWTEKQTQLLTQIIKQNQNSNKWNDVARKLFQRSDDTFFRSGKQCRERWLNHLDPNKKRGEWEEEEDKIIIRHILNHGRKWSNIAKLLGNHRTQHMVKNRFKTLIIKQKKNMPRVSNENTLLRALGVHYFGETQVPTIKSEVLKAQIFSSISEELSGSLFEQDQIVKNDKKKTKKAKVQIPWVYEDKQSEKDANKAGQPNYFQNFAEESKSMNQFIGKKPVLQCQKGVSSVSTPMSNIELQQVYSPYYLNFQGMTPYLSPSPSVPFFMNSSFSAFDNVFNQNLFIRPGFSNNSSDKSGFGF